MILDVAMNKRSERAKKAVAARIAKYGVRDARDIIAFSIGVLKEADGSPIAVQQKDGRIIKFIPKAIQKNAS